MNLLPTIVFGVVGLVLSYEFFIPPELSMFRLIAAIGMMVGYRVGQLVGRLVRPSPKKVPNFKRGRSTLLLLCVCVCQHDSNGISQYIRYRELGCATWPVFSLAGIFIALHTRSCSKQN